MPSDPQCCYHGCEQRGQHTVRITMPPLQPPLHLVGGTTLDVDALLCPEHYAQIRKTKALDRSNRISFPNEAAT